MVTYPISTNYILSGIEQICGDHYKASSTNLYNLQNYTQGLIVPWLPILLPVTALVLGQP